MALARSSAKNNSTANLGFEAKLWLAASEVRNQNDKGRTRPQRANEGVCTAGYPIVRQSAESHGGAGPGQTIAALRNIGHRELLRSRSRSQQTRVHRQMRRFAARTEESAYWPELLDDAGLVDAAKLQPIRQECDELTAIFVTIIKRAREQG